MRPVTGSGFADLLAHGEGKRALVLFHLVTFGGLRIFCRRIPPDALIGQSGGTFFLDGTWVLDGSVVLGFGSEQLLGVHDWVVDGGRFTQGMFAGTSPLRSFRTRELSALALTLSNEPDGEGHPRMSRILAQEPVVGARLDVRVGFEGEVLDDVLPLASFIVQRTAERRAEVVLECEGV